MPIYKRELTARQETLHRDTLRRLSEEGIVDPPECDLQPHAAFEIQFGSPMENLVFEGQWGGFAHYAIRVRLTSQKSGIVLTEYDFSTPFDSGITLESIAGDGPTFNFLGETFPRREILNLRFENGLHFQRRGQVVEGWLLWTGSVPLPRNLADGEFVACDLTLWDSLASRNQAAGMLSWFRATNLNLGLRRWVGLYAVEKREPDAANSLSCSGTPLTSLGASQGCAEDGEGGSCGTTSPSVGTIKCGEVVPPPSAQAP